MIARRPPLLIGKLYPVFGVLLIVMAGEGFRLSPAVSYIVGAACASALLAVYGIALARKRLKK